MNISASTAAYRRTSIWRLTSRCIASSLCFIALQVPSIAAPAPTTIATTTPGALPKSIEAQILNTPKLQDVFPVSGYQPFGGQILKVGSLVFQPGARLVLTNSDAPWIVVVADKIQFVDASSDNTIIVSHGWTPGAPPTPPATPATPPTPNKNDSCVRVSGPGQPGGSGISGQPGSHGENAPKVPDLYLITSGMLDKTGLPIPQLLHLVFRMKGYDGGTAGDGGTGGRGGDGGSGGDGDWDSNLFNPHCRCGANDGGPAGLGGPGGPGGIGGNASSGGNMVWIGTQLVLDALSYSSVSNQPGTPGAGGFAGSSGVSGNGGSRGSHPGACGGGRTGSRPSTQATPYIQNSSGAKGTAGKVNQDIDNNIFRYFK